MGSEKRIFVNAATCVVGGGVQVAAGFVRHACAVASARGWRLSVAVSEAVARECEGCEATVSGWWVAPVSPASPLRGRPVRRELRRRAAEFGAEIVFTVFGPSYMKFDAPELAGFADGFVMNPLPGCYANHTRGEALRGRFNGLVKRLALRFAREYWVETATARAGLARVLNVAPERIHVVSNGVNGVLARALATTGTVPDGPFTILLLGAAYLHKNHALLPAVVRELRRLNPPRDWRFAVTLPEDSPVWGELREAGAGEHIVNWGKLSLTGCAEAYARSSAVFHPSLLETFSATYLEAMAASRPLVVSDRPFAHEICGDAAVYVDPLDPAAAARALAGLMEDTAAREALVAAGRRRLGLFPAAEAKNNALCDLADAFHSRVVTTRTSE